VELRGRHACCVHSISGSFRSIFVDKSLRSVGDGLLVAGNGGQIVFVIGEPADILGTNNVLLGSSLLGRLTRPEKTMSETLEGCCQSITSSGKSRSGFPHATFHFGVISCFENHADRGRVAVVGIVASLSE